MKKQYIVPQAEIVNVRLQNSVLDNGAFARQVSVHPAEMKMNMAMPKNPRSKRMIRLRLRRSPICGMMRSNETVNN